MYRAQDDHCNQSNKDVNPNEFEESVDFILSHFSHQLNLFPRKMMTDHRRYQFTVYSKEEIEACLQQADYIDCRINAYPEYVEYKGIVRQPPDLVFIDLDLTDFNNDKGKIDRILKRILNKIVRVGTKPTVLWSGNSYHIYIPLDAIVLDQIDLFTKENFPSLFQSTFGKYRDYSVSEVFLKFAKQYFSNGKADPLNHPKYKNTLSRFPGTYNSKCLNQGLGKKDSEVKIIQSWKGKRLPIQLLLKDFRRWIVQEEINEHKKQSQKSKSKVVLLNNHSQKSGRIEWIEKLLQTPIEDHRNYCLWAILIPYLLNVKNLSEEDTFNILKEWLQKCNELRKLSFDPKSKIYSTIRGNREYKPISYTKLKDNNTDLLCIIESKYT